MHKHSPRGLGLTVLRWPQLSAAPALQHPLARLAWCLLGAATGIGLALAWMLLTRTVHPPAGATPLVMVHAQVGWGALWSPVLLGVLALVAVVMVWSRLYPRLVHYPVQAMAPSPSTLNWGGWD